MILETADVNRIDLNILIGNVLAISRIKLAETQSRARVERRGIRRTLSRITHNLSIDTVVSRGLLAGVTSASRRANAPEFGDAAKGAGMKPGRCDIQQQLPERQPTTDTTSARNDTAG